MRHENDGVILGGECTSLLVSAHERPFFREDDFLVYKLFALIERYISLNLDDIIS